MRTRLILLVFAGLWAGAGPVAAATVTMSALNLIASSTEPFPSNPFAGGYSHTFPTTTGSYTYTFENAYIGASGFTVHPDWRGTGTVSYTMNDLNTTSNAFHSVADRVTEYHDFNPGDLPNASGDVYNVYGRGVFGFNGATGGGAVDHDWTVTYDFSTLDIGYLPTGTLIGFVDIDGTATGGESMLLSAVLDTGGTDPWMAYSDHTTNTPPAHGMATYDAIGNTYFFDGPSVSNQAIAYLTTEDLASVTFDITNGAGGGSVGFKFAAPVPEPSGALLVSLVVAGFAGRRRR